MASVALRPLRRRRSRAALLVGLLAGVAFVLLCVLWFAAVEQATFCGGSAQAGAPTIVGINQPRPTAFARRDIPALYLTLYEQAGARFGIDWSVLAGIGWAECDHGRDRDPSCHQQGAENSAGAGGPMQFLASTFATYAIAAPDGRKDRWDPRSAIPSAANYLRASGAPQDYRSAVFAYNHADWYVSEVLARAQLYSGQPAVTSTAPTPPVNDAAAQVAPLATPTALAPPNFGSAFSFQDLYSPRVGPGWGAHGWESDFDDASTASGISAAGSYPGISFWHLPTLRGYWLVSFPNRRSLVLRQIDTGPNVSLHRLVDVDYAAVVRAGYSLGSYPTGPSDPNGSATTIYLGNGARWAPLNGSVVNPGTLTNSPTSGSAGCVNPDPPPATNGYIDPFRGPGQSWGLSRNDQGVDFDPNRVEPVLAIGAGTIVDIGAWSGYGPWFDYKLANGTFAGRCIYVAEHITNVLPAGTKFNAGATLATAIPGSPNTEWGWAQSLETPSVPWSICGCTEEDNVDPGGRAFARFLRSLGAHTEQNPGPGPLYAGASC